METATADYLTEEELNIEAPGLCSESTSVNLPYFSGYKTGFSSL